MADADFKILNGVLKKYRGHDDVVIVPECVEEIGNFAFRWNNLREIVFPRSLKRISECAFYGCEKLNELILPPSLESIGVGSFICCRGLQDVRFPDYLGTIGFEAFLDCSSLSKVMLPEWTDSIGGNAFKGCGSIEINAPGLREITQPVCDEEAVLIAPASPEDCCEKARFSLTLGYARQRRTQKSAPAALFVRCVQAEFTHFLRCAEQNTDVLALLTDARLLDKEQADRLAECYTAAGDAAAAGMLLEYKKKHFPTIDPFSEFEL